LQITPIGHLLTTDFLTVFPNNLVSEVIDKIKKETADFSYLYTIYVVNQENQLIGVFDLHELLLQSLETPVYRFMTQNLIVVHLNTPLEIVYKKMIKYKLNLLPVIDFKKNILGVVSFDDISETFIKK
jgi:magnesium transporter